MPRECRSVRIVAVCARQSRGRFCGLTGLPTASKTTPPSLWPSTPLPWQRSCGAQPVSCRVRVRVRVELES
eukprot:scaffold36110_cov65-Phaeocystis_antarctica.AAC.1